MHFLVKQVHKILLKKQKTIAVAESCSGGLLSKVLTDLPGSSRYFILGIVAYSNKAKINLLGIPSNILKHSQAVSKEVASLMAKKIRQIVNTDLGIGITGIAGPTGGTAKLPKGTVFIALETKNKKICKEFHFKGNRLEVRKKAVLNALSLIKNLL
ncbi:MAG: CinA family protein [Candidatus Omnitrophica bacterium]|nr:CinA family protein [Candidatus Omnitrophota bacterium]